MKFLFILPLVALNFLVAERSAASGCGGPEYYRQEASVIASFPFNEIVQAHNVSLTTTLYGPADLRLIVFTEKLVVKGAPYFYWHQMKIEGDIPMGVTPMAIEAGLDSAIIELVRDRYILNCTKNNKFEGFETNLRVFVNYNGRQLEFRTDYLPDVDK